MNSRLAVWLFLIAAAAAAQTTTTSGTFTLVDTDNVLGQGQSVTLNTTNATYAATATFDTTIPTQIDAFQFAVTPTGTGGIFTLNFDNGGSAIQSGPYTVDGVNTSATLSFQNGTGTTSCQAAFGTVTISALTRNAAATTTSAFSNLQGSYNLSCTNVTSTISGTFGFTSTSTPTPPPPPPTGGTGDATIPTPQFGPPLVGGTPIAPTSPTPPPAPVLTISGPVQTLLAPVTVSTGNTATLQFTTIGNSSFDSPVTLSAMSDQAGPTFTFSSTTIPAPGTGTSNLTVGTNTAVPGNFLVTVTASGGGLTALTTFQLDIVCDPPVITGLGEPASSEIANGGTAQLNVALLGSGPFTYQWYQGFQGFTSTPIDGATGPTLNTAPLNGITQYWVRVSNPCGSVDSTTATITEKP